MFEKVRPLFNRLNRRLKQFHVFPDVGLFGGVCAGIAYSFGLPTWSIRLFFIFFMMIGDHAPQAFPCILYVCLWILVPNGPVPEDYKKRTGH